MKTVFLGGTCNNSLWRDELIPKLKINYFNPVVKNWTPECRAAEIEARKNSDFVLYIITNKMTGVYSIAEVVDDSNKRPEKTVFCVLNGYDGDFEKHNQESLAAVSKMVAENGGTVLSSLDEIANYLNK